MRLLLVLGAWLHPVNFYFNLNAIPVFADVELETFNIDPNKIEKLINKKTKALVVTSIYGHPANLYKIKKIAKKYNLKIIEDVAQSPGAKINKKFIGTIGDIGVFSLNFNKHIHTGEEEFVSLIINF